ncbi:MAG: HU family DNA-binding protein [Prevotella sp.]|nr:HU family DNA-binding protein [Prevotella sp.]MCM1075293.1 HU family DNA-binding protein [Ruminococcus sp.]
MNNKISLPELSDIVARISGYNQKACELFLRELFDVVAQTVSAGENVKIKGIGTFKSTVVEERKSVNVNTGEQMIIPSHRKISFTPEKSLADAVNAPFAMFEPVELNDDVTEELLNTESETTSEEQTTENSDFSVSEPVPAAESDVDNAPIQSVAEKPDEEEINAEENIPFAPPANISATQTVQEETPDSSTESESADTAEQQIPTPEQPVVFEEPVNDDSLYYGDERIYSDEEYYPTPRKSNFWKGILVGALCAIAIIAGCMLAWRFIWPDSFTAVTNQLQGAAGQTTEKTDEAKIAMQTADKRSAEDTDSIVNVAAAADSTSEITSEIKPVKTPEDVSVPTQASDAKQSVEKSEPKEYNDKITKTRFLTTMAREYYGDYNLWPYIYDYNKTLGHPDRIRPGTKIKVPSLTTLGINPKDPAVIKQARKRWYEIYNKYRK